MYGYRPTNEQVLDFLKSLEIRKNRKTIRRLFRTATVMVHQNLSDPECPTDTPCRVTMPNGEKIDHRRASDTLVEVIEKLGIEQVKILNRIVRPPDSSHIQFSRRHPDTLST